MLTLTNPVQAYAWGAVDGLSELTGTPPTGGPEAELWVGAHPASPSITDDGRPLHEVLADEPSLLGPELADGGGPRLPFLLKVLAIGAPLSIQLHPSRAQAEAGFAREEAAGLPLDDPRRSYRDPLAKPEVLVALAPTWMMVGFRPGAAAAALLAPLATEHPAVAALRDLVAAEPDARLGLIHLLAAPDEMREALAGAAAAADPQAGPEARWVAALAEAYPGDPTALSPLLLELRQLPTGHGIFLPAGVPHAYLEGAGVELMGASDNVVRGGLTPKHVDREELVRLLAPLGTRPLDLPGAVAPDGHTSYVPAVADLALHRAPLGPEPTPMADEPAGPALVLVLGGSGVVEVGDQTAELGRGQGVLVAAGERAGTRLSGTGTAWWATAGGPAGT